MGLSVIHTTPQGRILINQDVLDIANRLQKGDATLGWEGDPRFYVLFNQITERYEVHRLCEDGKSRIISSHPPEEFNHNVVRMIAENDIRKHGVDAILARVDKHNARIEKHRTDEANAVGEEMVDYMRWASEKLYEPGMEAPKPHGRNLGG